MKALKTQFPDSNRVKLLEGQLYEAEGKNPLGIYEAILEADPSNVTAMKRRVCVYRAQNNNRLAVRELNAYLSLYSTDSSAWQELTQLYIEQEKLELAKFCVEELILLHPENYLYHLQYAELCHSISISTNKDSHDNRELAKQYYAQALELKPHNNLRALYGLCTSLRSESKQKKKQEETRKFEKTYTRLVTRLLDTYTTEGSPEHLKNLVYKTFRTEEL